MNKKADSEELLFELFAGEYVSIIMDMMVENVTQSATEVEMIKAPLTVAGFLSDADGVYYYLGHEPNVFNQAVKKDKIVHIEVIEEPKEQKEHVFKDTKGPDGKNIN